MTMRASGRQLTFELKWHDFKGFSYEIWQYYQSSSKAHAKVLQNLTVLLD